jgi:hypothetical protein
MPGAYIRKPVGWIVRNLSDTGPANCFDAKKWRSCDEKKLGHIRAWHDSFDRCGCEPDDSGRSRASWLSRRSNRRRPGGRGNSWRSTRGPKALLSRLCLRARLFRAAMLHPTRTLLGRMALARSPCRGLLLSSGSGHRTGEMRTTDDAGGADQAAVLVAPFA